MTVRRLDPVTGDIVTSGKQFISEREEVAQTIKTRLRLFYGEYFRNITDGTHWFQVVFDKNSTLSAKDAVIKRRIARTKDVLRILSYNTSYDINSRTYSISGSVLTTFGIVELNINEAF